MAVTKTHPIKSTLKAAIDYICNPDKTDGKLLVSSFGCTVETADIEFAWTRRHAIDKGTNLGRHLIQAFEPGEVTPEEAHRIGMELAREVLGGKYEFVLTTHIDRDHVHNHLIFNAVSFQDHRHYHSNKRSYHEIRRTSDRICKEHGLSVIVPGRDKGKSYIEHQAEQNGTSYKAKLRSAIDRLLVPLLYAYVAACCAQAALGNEGLKKLSALIKGAITFLLTGGLLVFVGYLTASGAIAGSADAAAVKAAKLAISRAVPVVGGILSDAAETVLAGAGVLRGTVGVVGTLVVLAICIVPFLQLAFHYLTYKGAAVLTGTVADSGLSRLMDEIGGAFGLILGMTGSCALILLFSIVSAVSAVASP